MFINKNYRSHHDDKNRVCSSGFVNWTKILLLVLKKVSHHINFFFYAHKIHTHKNYKNDCFILLLLCAQAIDTSQINVTCNAANTFFFNFKDSTMHAFQPLYTMRVSEYKCSYVYVYLCKVFLFKLSLVWRSLYS